MTLYHVRLYTLNKTHALDARSAASRRVDAKVIRLFYYARVAERDITYLPEATRPDIEHAIAPLHKILKLLS
jgi:hypothetical protein